MTIEGIDVAHTALAQGQAAVLWTRLIFDTQTPLSAALKLMQPQRGDWMLESVEGGERRGRYSLIGIDPDLLFTAHGNKAQINRNWRNWQGDSSAFVACEQPTLAALRALIAECRFAVPNALPKALAVLVGYFSYEVIRLVESIPPPADVGLGLPDMIFARPSIILIFDQVTDELFIIAPLWPPAADSTAAPPMSDDAIDSAIARASVAIEECATRLADPLVSSASAVDSPTDHSDALPDPADIQISPHNNREQYAAMVARAKDYINAGDIFQVVLSQRFTAPFPLPAASLYRALRRINPSPFLYFLDLPRFSLIGSSPEILVRLRDGEVTIRPIAGTRPRGKDRAEDDRNRDSLLADPKERAEHLMLLDLGRHDVGRVAKGNSVAVTDSFFVEYYSHVMHIVSNVTGQLADDKDMLDALFSGFPAGTVSGAPKIRACEIIAELEQQARGPYAGAVGYFAPDGNMDSCIVLRTAIVKDGQIFVQAGAGITADSNADYEQRECEAKADALFAAAREAIAQANEARQRNSSRSRDL